MTARQHARLVRRTSCAPRARLVLRGISRRHDDGSATIWVLVASMLVGAAATATVLVGGVASTRARAFAAADLAALAAAAQLRAGEPVPCAAARRVAERNDARLRECVTHPATGVVDVSVEASGRGLLARVPPVHVRARAGPSQVEPTGGSPPSDHAPAVPQASAS